MLDTDDLVHIAFLSSLDISAIIINAIYISIIRRRTPKDLSAYAFLLLNIACVDLLSALCNFMCIDRTMFVNGRIVYVYIGACTLMNAQACHFFQSAHVELIGQSIYLLLISFICRLWMFKASYKMNLDITTIFERIQIATAIAAVYTLFSIVAFYLAGSYDVYGNYTVSALVMLGDYDDILLPRFAFITLFITLTLGFGAIFVLRRKLFSHLRNLSSAADRSNHKMIYHSLTVQMLLPLAYNFGLGLWFVDALGIVHSRTLQRTVFISTSIFPIVSPLVNMYYIPPYRRYIKSLFTPSKRVVPTSSSEFTVSETRL